MTPFIEPSIQAWAMLHGHLYIDPISVHEQVTFGGHHYLLHPPLAALVMMPFVAVFGLQNAPIVQQLVSIGMGLLSCGLAAKLVRWNLWLMAFYALGTTLLYEAFIGASWDMVLVVSTVPTLLALNEVRGKKRPWLVGMWAGLAALGRYDLALAWPFYLASCLRRSPI